MQGHRSLVERARRENATVVVSVFVNPTQFNDKNDLRHYPRTPEADARLLEEAGADFVLMPSVEEIYPEEDTRIFDFGQIDKVMEGATRPDTSTAWRRSSAACSTSYARHAPTSGRRISSRSP